MMLCSLRSLGTEHVSYLLVFMSPMSQSIVPDGRRISLSLGIFSVLLPRAKHGGKKEKSERSERKRELQAQANPDV